MTISSVYQQYADNDDNTVGPFPFLEVDIGGTVYKIPFGISVNSDGSYVDFATSAKQDTQITHEAAIAGTVETVGSTGTPTTGIAIIAYDDTNDSKVVLRTTDEGRLRTSAQLVAPSGSLLATNSGAVNQDTLRTISASDDPGVTYASTIAGAIYTTATSPPSKVIALGGVDNQDTGNVIAVNCQPGGELSVYQTDGFTRLLLTSGSALVGNSGVVTAGTLRVVHATDDPIAATTAVGSLFSKRIISIGGWSEDANNYVEASFGDGGEQLVRLTTAVSVGDITGTISLPTGAATAAKQDTQITHAATVASAIYTDVATGTVKGMMAAGWSDTFSQPITARIDNGTSGTALRVTISNDSTGVLASIGSITNWGNVVDDAAFTPATTRVSVNGYFADETSTDSVDEGDAGAARMTLDRKQIVTDQPHTQGGCLIFRSLDLDETEEDVKTSRGQIYGGWISNLSTGTRYVKIYNATAANVTVGTTTPVLTLPIPANDTQDVSGLLNMAGGKGIEFDTAISIACTTGLADNDVGAPGVNEVVINLFYK